MKSCSQIFYAYLRHKSKLYFYLSVSTIIITVLCFACKSKTQQNALAQNAILGNKVATNSKHIIEHDVKQQMLDSIRRHLPHSPSETLSAYLKTSDIVYCLEPHILNGHCGFVINLAFKTRGRNMTWLSSFNYGSIQQHFESVGLMEHFTSDNKIETVLPHNNNKGYYPVYHHGEEIAFVRYIIIQDPKSYSKMGLLPAFPLILLDKLFFASRSALLLMPHEEGVRWNDNHQQGSVTLIWKNMPKQWQWANNLGSNDVVQTYQGNITKFVVEGIFCGGNIHVLQTSINNSQVIITQMLPSLALSRFTAHLLPKIITAQRNFLQVPASSPYHAIIFPLESLQRDEYYGHAFPTTFVAYISEKMDTLADAMHIKYLLAHEILHTWNNHTERVRNDTHSGFGLYFVEGFTDYFARKILLNAGLISLQEYLEHYNSSIKNYYTSEHKTASASRMLSTMSLDPHNARNEQVKHVAYWKGDILAHNWNREIQRYTNNKYSLDDVFRIAMQSKEVVTDTSFVALLKPYIGRDVMPDILSIMRDGKEIVPDPEALGAEVTMHYQAKVRTRVIVPLFWERIPYYAPRTIKD